MEAAWLTPPETPTARGRVASLGVILLGVGAVIAVLCLFSGTVQAMVSTWYGSNSFNHCFLILPISGYLAWQRRGALVHATVSPDWRGGLAIGVAAAGWLIGDVTGTQLLEQISLVVALQSLVLAIYGWTIFRILLFPLLYLFFAVPFGLELIPPLQTVTAFLSVALLKATGIPVFSDGYLISIPSGNWYVADACSGIRYVISSLALGALFAGSMYVSWPRRALVMVIAVVVPILANGIRAFGIILLAYLSDNELATGVDHLIYGWLFFTLVSCVVLAIGISFREPQPDFDKWGNGQISRKVPLGRCVLAATVAFLLVGAAKIYGDHVDQIWSKQTIQLRTPQFTGYPQREAIDDQFLPRFPSADSELDAVYGSGEQNFYLRIGYYLSERRGVQAISFNHELPGSPEMLIVSKGETQTMLGKDAISIRYQRIASGNKGRLIWYWFWVDGRMIGNPYTAKLLEAKAKLLGGRQPAAVIALAVDYRGDPASAENALHAFLRDTEPLYGALDHAQTP